MNLWTSLLESFHSALIDELTERHPEPKPGLGMPIRLGKFALPNDRLDAVWVCDVTQGETHGVVCLGIDAAGEKKLGIGAEKLWLALGKRAGSEFMRRGIQPKLGQLVRVKQGAPLPAGFPEPQRLIWVPFEIGGSFCYLGMGV